MRLLIVDRSIEIVNRLVNLLSDSEIITSIQSAVSYEEARNLFKQNKHDTLLLDIGMQENESFKLLEEIQKTGGKLG
jgi:two-component SAPR family response regulator